jgi:lipopolysaccharide transport protein LptA
MKQLSAALVTAVILGLLASLAAADEFLSWGRTSDQPMDIAAGMATFRRTEDGGEISFKGNVKVKQGDMTLRCDRLVTLYDEHKRSGKRVSRKNLPKDWRSSGKPKSMTATGNVKMAQEELRAFAGKALFDDKTRTITLTERPRVRKGQDLAVAAHTIIIYLDENRYEALGKDGRPIRVTINFGKQEKK